MDGESRNEHIWALFFSLFIGNSFFRCFQKKRLEHKTLCSLYQMGTQRIGRPSDKLSVIVVDENLCHANTARRVLVKLDFQGKYLNKSMQPHGAKTVCIQTLIHVL